MMPTGGPSAAGWRRTLLPAQAQLVELRVVVQEVVVPVYVEAEQLAPPVPLPFARIPNEQLLGYGVPENGSTTSGPLLRTACLTWQTICRPRQRRLCWSWLWAELRSRPYLCRWVAIRSATPTPCAGSAP